MKALKIIILAFLILLPSSAFSGEVGKLRISLIEGDAYLYTEDAGDWFEASVNMPLVQGDTLWVSEGGRAELHFEGSGYLRLDGETMLDVLSKDDGPAEFSLTEGRIYVNVDNNRFDPLLVRTPTASARIREAVAMIDISGSGETRISVLAGDIEAEAGGRTRWLYAGESMYVDTDRYTSISSGRPEPDEWERWNRRLDGELTGSFASVRHLPRELRVYARDFDRGGRWLYVREYGYVWTPTVSISIGWAPFKHGRWSWRRGSYVWVSYEPWGWAPYHYGRWAFVSRVGWCWVPPRRGEVHWGPGYVAWIYKPTYVAWVPLAPGEIYYGYGNYGRHSVNIVNININSTVIKFEYKNVNIRNAVTAVVRDAFLKGKRVAFKFKRNPFLTERPHVGPPRERPERHRDPSFAGRDHDRRRPPVAGKHRPKERWRPGKPILFKGVSVKRDAPSKATPKRRKAAPPGKGSADRQKAMGKDRGPAGNERPHAGPPRKGPGSSKRNASLDDRRRPPAAGKHGTNGQRRPEKPLRGRDLSVKRDAPGKEAPKRRKEVPSVKRNVNGPTAVGKGRGLPERKGVPGKAYISPRERRVERRDARAKTPRAAGPSARSITKGKPPKGEVKAAPKGKSSEGKASAAGERRPGRRGLVTGTAKGKGIKTPRVTGAPTVDGKGFEGRRYRFSGRGIR